VRAERQRDDRGAAVLHKPDAGADPVRLIVERLAGGVAHFAQARLDQKDPFRQRRV
jgi:hypothetical protein